MTFEKGDFGKREEYREMRKIWRGSRAGKSVGRIEWVEENLSICGKNWLVRDLRSGNL
jgi:hypothetical protein